MCTLISIKKANHLLFAMNRDINICAAHREEFNGKELWYPVDPGSGGSWIGLNSRGHIAALLYYNIPGAKFPESDVERSRGDIVPHVLAAKNFQPEELELSCYSPFQLYYSSPSPFVLRWNGSDLVREELNPSFHVLTSSWYGWADMKRNWITEKIGSEQNMDRKGLEAFMKIHEPGEQQNMHVCMHGEWSETTASTIIEIMSHRALIYMLKGNPCQGEFSLSREMEIGNNT